MLSSNQRERRVSRLNRTGKNTTGWARRLTALLVTACLVMAMALPVYAEVDLLPDAPDEVELLEDEPGTASGEDTALPEQNAATPVPDAATPEPEQSAEPEQPAPTETPEPTAEPTPTPEPAATATATPVPTVTPTATPEPTEQPQKMYAAESVDDVQAASEQEAAEGFTVYFAVNSGNTINGNTIADTDVIKFNGQMDNSSTWCTHPMEKTTIKTSDGRTIYALRNCTDASGNKFTTIQIQLWDSNGGWKTQIVATSGNAISYYNLKMYDAKDGTWTDASTLEGNKYFAGKTIKFENRSTAELTNVKANFYIPDENGNLTPVNGDSEVPTVAKGGVANFIIPTEACSYVQFTWVEDGEEKSSKFYNFYNESVSDDKESFMYSETSDCFIYTDADNVRWGIEKSFRIYYDATFSKLPTTGRDDTGGDYSIPKANSKETIYFRIKGEDGVKSKSGTLVKDGTNENLYYVDIPQEYSSNSSIIFSGEEIGNNDTTKGHGLSTAWLPIPKDDKNCFYADTNDDAVYKDTTRGGYWAPKGTKRDAETWKKTESGKQTEVVDIASVPFTEKPNTKYVTSTLYDYYTDYELNGKNRDSYDNDNAVNQRHWVPFRQFDQAISDYYQSYVDKNTEKPIIYPIYTGHFQPSGWNTPFSAVAETLNLYGWAENYQIFIAANNSNFDTGNRTGKNSYAFQGIVADKRDSDGDIVMNGTTLKEPHFNEKFLTSQNSKNAKLGEVYHNVEFPFTQEEVFVEPEQNGQKKGKGIKYWWFDSSKTSLYLRKDTNSDQLYLGNDSTTGTTAEYKSEKSRNVDSASNPDKVSTQYGFFPFNETITNQTSAVKYNYGYGAKLEIPFTLTSTGTVEDDYKNEIPIRFYFSGDDDVWVFIDDQLVLDIGGAHAKVSGMLEFDQRGDKKNTVTSYVSRVKNSKTDKYGADECDEHSPTMETSITYLGTTEKYYKNASVPISGLSTGKHTLTMYYMERGMWESNMAVAFNFPDNNELQVQKKVDLTNVTDEDFQNCFKKQKIFNFTIQNQATHYGPKAAAVPDESKNPSQKVDLTKDVDIAAATPGKEDEYIFRRETNPWPDSENKDEQVLHWYARYTDTEPVSKWRKNRYGILKLNEPINIKDMRFLTFQVYVNSEDGGELSLNNLYLELLDEKDVQKGSLGTTGINGATYGSVELKTGEWVTVKLDLHKMKEQDGFSGNVKTIRVGDNYSRHIYFRNFTFIPKAVPTEMTGFTTDQEKIPDYGSAESGHLENAENAQYTSNMDTDTQLVDENGRFVLEDGEIVTFSDQFRRGSYISLREDLNENLYDTTWTVYENGQKVTSMKEGESVILPSPTPSLIGQVGSGPDDGRTEKIKDDEKEGNNYTGTKPDNPNNPNTIVFRSYKDPDEKSSTLTKLKVEYVNTVKTGGLKIQKQAAAGENDIIKGTYKFKVTFDNVGGEGLEEDDIIRYVEINMSDEVKYPDHTVTITGIPVGTRYTIEEVKTDDSRLQSVTVPEGQSAQVIYNTMVEGKIVASENPDNLEVTAIFTNTKRKLINIEFNKLWKDADGTDLSTKNPPDTIYIQLQRRLKNGTGYTDWEPVNYPTAESPKYVTINRDDYGWKCIFNNLDQYPVGDSADNNYIYRIVEGTVEKGEFKQAAEDGTITIDGKTYVVKAEATAKSETDSAGSSTGNTATANSETNSETGATTTPATATDGTITGGSGKIVLTNKLQNPKFVLDIIKKDAEKDKNNNEVFLKDVEFKLEKLVETTTGGESQWVVDKNYKFDSTKTDSITGTTGTDGKITPNPFTNLEPGTYRLTETKAHPEYNLLAQPIVIKFTQDGKCYIDGQLIEDKDKFTKSGNTYTMTLTVLNRKTPELPHTGADAPSLWLLIGMPLAVAGLLIFTFRYNRKGGRRH